MRVVIFWIMCHLSPGHEKKALLIFHTKRKNGSQLQLANVNIDKREDKGRSVIDHVPPLTRSRKKGALNISYKEKKRFPIAISKC